MKKEETKQFIRWCIAAGGFLYYSDDPYMGGSHGMVCRLSGAAEQSGDPHGSGRSCRLYRSGGTVS